MTLPIATAPRRDAVPSALRSLQAWLLWRYEPGATPEKKPLKVPYYIDGYKRNGVQGSPTDRSLLATFDDALTYVKPGFGLGLAMLPEHGIVGLDFDNVVTDGVVDPAVEGLVSLTYAEISPSGKGVRAFMLGDAQDRKAKTSATDYGFETFHAKGFLTITGNVLPICDLVGAEITPMTDEIRALADRRFGKAAATTDLSTPQADDLDRATALHEVTDATVEDFRAAILSLDADDRQVWINVGLAAKSLEQAGRDEAFEIWRDWSARSEKYDYDEALAKWQGFEPSTITYRSVFKAAADAGWANPKTKGAEKLAPAETAPGHPRFHCYSIDEIMSRPPQRYFVRGVIPRAPLVVVFGESGAGKTFAVLDLVLAIARGVEWRGKKVEQGRVVYVAAEGQGGFVSRLKAYTLHHGVDSAPPFHIITDVPNLLSDDHKAMAKSIAAAGGADLIVVDTLAQTTAGANENSGEDMGLALKNCASLHRATGATVLLVHHAGKDVARGARGWSGLKAAADAELSVERVGDSRVLRVTKLKDGQDNESFGFRLASISVGMDDEGDIIESAVVEATVAAPKVKAKPLGVNQDAVLSAVRNRCSMAGGEVPVEEVMHDAIECLEPPAAGLDRRDERAKRAMAALIEKGWIVVAGGLVNMAEGIE